MNELFASEQIQGNLSKVFASEQIRKTIVRLRTNTISFKINHV